jgi:hypothetical protein
MDKKTKFYLKNIIKESISTDVDEMADRPKGTRYIWGDPKTPPFKNRPVWSRDNPTEPGGKGTPDGWILNPNKEKGKERLIIMYYDCGEYESLLEELGPMLSEIEEDYGLEPELVPCKAEGRTKSEIKRTIDQPRSLDVGTSYSASGNKYSGSEKIRRKLYSKIRSKLGSPYMNSELQKRSIPPIIIDLKYINTHIDEPTNEKVFFECHSYNSYDNLESFFESAISVLDGGDPSGMVTHHLARGFNTKYANWVRTKKQIKDYKGKTEKYKLDKIGLEKSNLDASILMGLKVLGEKEGNTFVWSAKISTYISKKKNDDKFVKEGSVDMFNKKTNVTVQIDSDKTFDDQYTVLDDEKIVDGLNRCLDDLVNEILSIDPESVLDFATMDVYMLGDSNVNENKKINYFVNSIINEIKNKNR